MLKDEADAALARADRAGRSSPCRSTVPRSGISSPAIMRSSVVLPEPDGPSSATSSPVSMSQADVVERDEVAELLADVAKLDTHAATLAAMSSCVLRSPALTRRSRQYLATSVTSASRVSSDATANAAAKS